MDRIIKEFAPHLMKVKKEEGKAIDDIKNAGLLSEKEKKLINEVKKIYNNNEKKEDDKKYNKDDEKDVFFSLFEFYKEYEDLEQLSN